jgi:KDO2-lipid IV(A) lauroyltransferase
VRHLLELLVFMALTAPLAALPYRVSIKVGEALGLLAHRLWGSRRRIALENMRGAAARNAISLSKSPEATVRENFRNMGRYMAEITKVYYGLGDSLVRNIKVEGIEHYRTAKERGRGVMLVGGHCANWELLVLGISSKVGRVYGVARKQSNPYIDRFIVHARQRYGSSIIYKQGVLRKFISVLKEGGTVGVFMDQAVLPDEGVIIDFLGAPAWTTRLPAAVAKRTGAAVVPCFLRWTGKGYEIKISPAVELGGDDAEDTKKLSAYIEDFIRQNPLQWLWIHRRWKRARPEQRSNEPGRSGNVSEAEN